MDPVSLLTSNYAKNYKQPVLVINPSIVADNIKRFRQAMPLVEINYAVKANPDKLILRAVKRAEESFEVASSQEVLFLRSINTDFSKVLYGNSIRTERDIDVAINNGITMFVADSKSAIDRVVHRANNQFKPCFYVRVIVPNQHSQFPLSNKFGADIHYAEEIITYTKQTYDLDVCGVSFHVGSQCTNPKSWANAIIIANEIFDYMIDSNITPLLLDIGGGYPIEYSSPVCSIEEIGSVVNEAIKNVPDTVRVVAEPGRYIAGTAGHLLCQIVKIDHHRNGKPWVYLDVGVFHGLAEGTVDGHQYTYVTHHDGNELVESTVAGPTCDSADIVEKSQLLPRGLQEGEFVVVKNMGAYCTTYGTNFNGFPSPVVMRFTA